MVEKKVLIVEDDEPVRDLYVSVFSENGFETYFASTGEEALELLKNEDIPVMFIDINMPGMSGFELATKIFEMKDNVILHAVTGYESSYNQDECLDAGFEEFFTKPVAMNELIMSAKHSFGKLKNNSVS